MTSAINKAMTYLIDTAKAIRRIEESGVARKQAAAIVETFADANEQIATKADLENLATAMKADIEKLQTNIEKLATDTKADSEKLQTNIENLRTDTKADSEKLQTNIENLRTDTKADIENLRNEMKTENKRLEALIQALKNHLLYRMVLTQLGSVGLLFGLIKFFE